MYKCKDCKQNTPYDYFAPDGVTCMDCISEEDYDLFRDADCEVQDEQIPRKTRYKEITHRKKDI